LHVVNSSQSPAAVVPISSWRKPRPASLTSTTVRTLRTDRYITLEWPWSGFVHENGQQMFDFWRHLSTPRIRTLLEVSNGLGLFGNGIGLFRVRSEIKQ
jgi:hypothetical protein